ncbi:hypothetical protein SAMN05421636_103314 [Pricia antarctica]|uniref:Uncharacterized protein n=1 Tax=Pricia antarctica TaxID=641691 RepID=A0A1G7ADT4_9FLAO|nr:hypothetical protein SAMN05421636_103314 [Pricia antarctica]
MYELPKSIFFLELKHNQSKSNQMKKNIYTILSLALFGKNIEIFRLSAHCVRSSDSATPNHLFSLIWPLDNSIL